jgi:hypothetical protein
MKNSDFEKRKRNFLKLDEGAAIATFRNKFKK